MTAIATLFMRRYSNRSAVLTLNSKQGVSGPVLVGDRIL